MERGPLCDDDSHYKLLQSSHTRYKGRFSSIYLAVAWFRRHIAGGGWRGRRLRAGGKQNRSTGRQSGPGVDGGTRRRSTNDRNINPSSPSCANNGRNEARPSTVLVLQLLTYSVMISLVDAG